MGKLVPRIRVRWVPMRWVALGLVCLLLGGCALVSPKPPKAVVAAAIAQQLAQTQAIFRSTAASPAAAQVSGIQIAEHRRVAVAGQPAVAVSGTYRLSEKTLSIAQKRQSRPFSLYLQPDKGQNQWRLLAPEIQEATLSTERSPQWQVIALPSTIDNPGLPSTE